MERYQDRQHAGKTLARELKSYTNRKDVIVLALPRGGVPVAYEIASALHVPLDVFIVRKLGVPGQEELAMGAIATGGVTFLNESIIHDLGIGKADIERVKKSEEKELKRRELLYRDQRAFPVLEKKVVILVDDGIATGATIRAAIQSLRNFNPAAIVIAVPVAAAETCEIITKMVDKFVCPLKPAFFGAVGSWYDYFDQTSDEEVKTLLARI